jgi:hypothetical protein
MTQQPDGRDRRQNAHESGKYDEPQVMGRHDTVVDFHHDEIPLSDTRPLAEPSFDSVKVA